MRVVFMGTPAFAEASLRALLASSHEVVGVVSGPDRPAGRGRRPQPCPVARRAREQGLPLHQPDSVRTRAFRSWLAACEPDIGVVAAYGRILGPKVLELPPHGLINVHASLLPRWRGAAPIQAALLAGDRETGVTIMRMTEGMDTGPMLHRVRVPIAGDETGESLHDRLAEVGGEALVDALDGLEAGLAEPVPQDEREATYAPPIDKGDGRLDWRRAAAELERRVRAFHPWPGTRSRYADASRSEELRIHPPVEVAATEGASSTPGRVLRVSGEGIDVACGDGRALRLHRLQAPGRRPLDVADFLSGFPLRDEGCFGVEEAS